MKIALAPFTLRDYRSKPTANSYKNDVKNILWRTRKVGYEGIEMGTPIGFSKEEYKDFVDEIGLQVVTAGGLRGPALYGDDFSASIEDCKFLGAKNVMIGSMQNLVLGNPYELKKFIAALNKAGKALMDEGLHLSYHNHAVDFSKINGATILRQIVEGTDERYVFFEPDTHWLQAGGGHVVSWLKALKGRMYMVHFKDYGIDPYSDHTFLECTHKQFKEIGEGNLNWPGIIAECRAQGIEWCAVEQDLVQRPAFEAIEISLNNLRAFGA